MRIGDGCEEVVKVRGGHHVGHQAPGEEELVVALVVTDGVAHEAGRFLSGDFLH